MLFACDVSHACGSSCGWAMRLIIFAVFLIQCMDSLSSVPDFEVRALHSLYIATYGNSWTFDEEDGIPWNFSAPVEFTDPCVDEWSGVACSSSAEDCVNTTCSIVKLNLGWFNMQG